MSETNPPTPDKHAADLAKYAELGHWARHYSAVRMTVTPFLMGVSLLIFHYGYKEPFAIFKVASLIIWLTSIGILIPFTVMSLEKTRQQLKVANELEMTRANVEHPSLHLIGDAGFWSAMALTGVYLFGWLGWWIGRWPAR